MSNELISAQIETVARDLLAEHPIIRDLLTGLQIDMAIHLAATGQVHHTARDLWMIGPEFVNSAAYTCTCRHFAAESYCHHALAVALVRHANLRTAIDRLQRVQPATLAAAN